MQMERWAASNKKAVFLCVCVDGKGVALRFGGQHSVNAYVEGRDDMPKFPAQLGCQGFVVLDAQRRFLEIRTKSFNQEREVAFRQVERLIQGEEKMFETDDEVYYPVGCPVQLGGFEGAEAKLNGFPGVVTEIGDGKLGVRLADKQMYIIPTANLVRGGPLEPVNHSDMDDEHSNLVQLLSLACRDVTAANIIAVRDAFAAHGSHEEHLLAQIPPTGSSSFSTLKSHADDHKRILRLADDAASSLSFDAVRALANAIYDHAENFDSKYAGKI